MRRAVGAALRTYTRRVNFREGCRGHLWQTRVAFFALTESYVLTALRLVELNPVRAGLVNIPLQRRCPGLRGNSALARAS